MGCQQAIRVASNRGTKYDAEFDSVWRNSGASLSACPWSLRCGSQACFPLDAMYA